MISFVSKTDMLICFLYIVESLKTTNSAFQRSLISIPVMHQLWEKIIMILISVVTGRLMHMLRVAHLSHQEVSPNNNCHLLLVEGVDGIQAVDEGVDGIQAEGVDVVVKVVL